MKRIATAVAAIGLAGSLGLATAASAQAACGQMDLARNPDTYVYLNWRTYSTSTLVEPHGGSQLMRAVIARYSGGVRYYFGPGVSNPYSYGSNYSYVSASNGSWVQNYYRWGTSGYNKFYKDYSYCKYPG